jgi:uncharacterized protein YprB with RNaseH-like and TPR domain
MNVKNDALKPKHKYIRARGDKWQARVYTDSISFSYTATDLAEVIAERNKVLGYDPDNGGQRGPRILFLDIETTPISAYVWGLWDQNISPDHIIEDWKVLCFGYKWADEDEAHVIGWPNFTTNVEYNLMFELFNLLENADIVVTHNGQRFDIKKINSKFFEHKIMRPANYKVVDTLKIAKRTFSLLSNRLDYIDKLLGGAGKLENEGMQLWIKCMRGDTAAWDKMIAYNLRDVLVLEEVYLEIRGWDRSHPNVAHYYEDEWVHCPSCGGIDLESVKPVYTQVSRFPAFRCMDCGQIIRRRKSTKRVSAVAAQ